MISRWRNSISRSCNIQKATAFIKELAFGFDLHMLQSVTFTPTTRTSITTGHCLFPSGEKHKGQSKQGYRLVCRIAPDITWPASEEIVIGFNKNRKPVVEVVEYVSPDEALVWIAGHEFFHFLRDSRQVPGRNVECQANLFGLKWLREFREKSAA